MKRKSKQNINTEIDYMMALARANGSRFGTCDRARVGAVIANSDGEVLANGWNTAPKGLGTCDQQGHIMVDGHCVRTLHAEEMALSKMIMKGKTLKNCTIYITHKPCLACLKLLAASGIKKIVYNIEYDNIKPIDFYNEIIVSYKITLEKYQSETR